MKLLTWILAVYGVSVLLLNLFTTLEINKWMIASAYLSMALVIYFARRIQNKSAEKSG